MYRILGHRPNLSGDTLDMANAWIGLLVKDPYGLPPGLVLRHDSGELVEMKYNADCYPDGLPKSIAEAGEYVDHV